LQQHLQELIGFKVLEIFPSFAGMLRGTWTIIDTQKGDGIIMNII
jgi:hypothetical protein